VKGGDRKGREGNGSMHPLGFSKVGAYANGSKRLSSTPFKSLGPILSGPGALLSWNVDTISSISCGVTDVQNILFNFYFTIFSLSLSLSLFQ